MKIVRNQKLRAVGKLAQLLSSRHYCNVIRPDLNIILSGSNNKGLGFTMDERQSLGVYGYWASSVRTMEAQLNAVLTSFRARADPIAKFMYLMSLRNRHERLYYRFVRDHTKEVLPIIYTPTVGRAIQMFSMIYRAPMGMFISSFDRGHIAKILQNWRSDDVRAVCVTDGGRVLGLGDMGANGLGITLGKLALYTGLAGVPPSLLLPIALDVGTDNTTLLNDPMYVGTRMKRIRGEPYEQLVDEFMCAVVENFGNDTFIHFEDFATPNALKFLKKYQHSFCCFNDDIQGTGATVLAGMLNVERLLKVKLQQLVILFAGAGSAVRGILAMLLTELRRRGLTEAEATSNIYIFEKDGLLSSDSQLDADICIYAKDVQPKITTLHQAVQQLKPGILVGATGARGLFSAQVLSEMGAHHERPAIFALSNPTEMSECTAEQAYEHTGGRAIYSSGSPFPPVQFEGKRLVPGQANNCLVFPGIALGAICMRARHMPSEIYSVAAHRLAKHTPDKSLASGNMYPSLNAANEVSLGIALDVAKYLIENDLSNVYPAPVDLEAYLQQYLYTLDYGPSLPEKWKVP
ncbi:Menl-2, partial [Drosophila busckii]